MVEIIIEVFLDEFVSVILDEWIMELVLGKLVIIIIDISLVLKFMYY